MASLDFSRNKAYIAFSLYRKGGLCDGKQDRYHQLE